MNSSDMSYKCIVGWNRKTFLSQQHFLHLVAEAPPRASTQRLQITVPLIIAAYHKGIAKM